MENFWFYIFNFYLQCTWMYLLSFSVSERFEFRRNWNVLGRSIGALYTRPLALSRTTIYKEYRPRNEFIYVELYSAVWHFTRFTRLWSQFFDLQGRS